MAWGRFLYLDDLAVVTVRQGAGLRTSLLNFVQEEARRAGCESVQLDTGYTGTELTGPTSTTVSH